MARTKKRIEEEVKNKNANKETKSPLFWPRKFMGLNKLQPARGRVLISDPALEEFYFHRAVVLLTEFNEEGTVGFVLNKPMELTLGQAVSELSYVDMPVFLGGPVGKENMFYLHTLGTLLPGSFEIIPGLWFGGDYQELKSLFLEGRVPENSIRFFIGYSGWSPGQLEEELEEKAWIVAQARREWCFEAKPENLWRNILKSMGSDYALLANFPEDPSLN